MVSGATIEIRESGQEPRRVTFDRAIEVGRECDGEIVHDDDVSQRHLKIVPSPTSLSVVDLGSQNGTTLNAGRITGRVSLGAGDVLGLGQASIAVVGAMAQSFPPAPTMAAAAPAPAPPPEPGPSRRQPARRRVSR